MFKSYLLFRLIGKIVETKKSDVFMNATYHHL